MIPLHLTSTTIHVAAHVADRLVRDGAAEWLTGVRALVATGRMPADIADIVTAA